MLMIDDALIHIGYHKTGSSWLQEEFFVDTSPYFLPLSEDGTSTALASDFVFTADRQLLSPFADNQAVIMEKLEKVATRSNGQMTHKIPVLSSERLSGNPHASSFDAKAIAERLYKVFPRGRVLIMIREQKSMILSCYFQYLASSGWDSLPRYLHTTYDGRRPGFSKEVLYYLPLIREYQRLFGDDRVLVLPFEMFRTEPARFLDHLGRFLELNLEIDLGLFDKKVNLKKYRVILYYFRWFNFFIKSRSLNAYSPLVNPLTSFVFRGLRRGLGSLTTAGMEKKMMSRLRRVVDREIGTYYLENNRALSQHLGMDLGAYGYH